MRQLAPIFAACTLVGAPLGVIRAQPPSPEGAVQLDQEAEADVDVAAETVPEVAPAPPAVGPVPAPPPTPPVVAAPPPEPEVVVTTNVETDGGPEVVGEGIRFMVSVQTNATIGQLLEDGSGGFSFERATLTGVPDALVGLRIGRLSAGLGLTWSQVSTPRVMMNPCTGEMEEFDRRRTLFGFIPTVRFDAIKTADGRARFDAGIAVPILLSSRTDEQATFMCPGTGRDTVDATDGVYGVDVMLGARYHIFPALTLGLDIGLSYLVFDADDDPDTTFDEPSVTTLTAYSGIVLAIELPL